LRSVGIVLNVENKNFLRLNFVRFVKHKIVKEIKTLPHPQQLISKENPNLLRLNLVMKF